LSDIAAVKILVHFVSNKHPEWRVRLSGTILKGDHSWTIPDKNNLIWFNTVSEKKN
jgi:hypothetical protein